MLHCTKTIEVEIFHDFYKRNTFSFSLYNGLGYLFKGFLKFTSLVLLAWPYLLSLWYWVPYCNLAH